MSIETDLYSYLSTHAGLASLIGIRIYPVQSPQKVACPYCVYFKVSPGRSYTHQGHSPPDRPRMQVSCFGNTYASAKAVAAQVIAAMEAWPAANSSVQAVLLDDEFDMEDNAEMGQTGIYHAVTDWIVWYG